MHPPRSLISAFTSLNNATSAGSSSSTNTGDTAPSGVASRTRRRGSLETVASNSTKASNSTSQPSSHQQPNNGKPHGQTDPLTFLASLEIDQSLLLEIIQEIISLYELWSLLEGPSSTSTNQAPQSPSSQIPNPSNPSGRGTKLEGNNMDQKMVGLIKRMQDSRLRELRDERVRASQIGLSGGNGVGTPGSGAGGKRG